ncbi:cobyrinate a,c-diamide synthase [Sneathiella chinensis]|uniref:Cobyrinate a,c-diamide synthase n=1 Tax=Sneathiella chinensis TaxID=349750 RepID=A0ABQ5U357_9PROT|nr:cobyrinate a,c-diamide synthase [Sneathiella chinensis]GLQ06163.1 cobyrinic acid a,c-diamide synthase [Sneathiella chinensis]
MTSAAAPAVLVAAPSSGSGKTVITLSLLRAFRNRGISVGSFKTGPDYIDPAFHAAASGNPCINLDPWAMRPETIHGLAGHLSAHNDLIMGEGVMGLFDGARDGSGSTADLAALLDIPVILIVDAKGMSQSAAALIKGFATFRRDVRIAGVLFNRVGSAVHKTMLADACRQAGVPPLGFVPRSTSLQLEHRHLGLVQAREKLGMDGFLDAAAQIVAENVDLDLIRDMACPARTGSPAAPPTTTVPAPGRTIAVAEDDAFSFTYPHILMGWRNAGAEIRFFSPLRDEAPAQDTDFIFLPGGYPELHAERLSGNDQFRAGMRSAAEKGTFIYGECGGFMTLSRSLTDRTGKTHPMLDLLPVHTSFEKPRIHLGYRRVQLCGASPFGQAGDAFMAHEFHYADAVPEQGATPLFTATNAAGDDLGAVGVRRGSVSGSFIHLIDKGISS